MTPEEMAVQAVVEAAKKWRATVYEDRLSVYPAGPSVWSEERALAAAVDALAAVVVEEEQ